ncbi:MAG: hypothetical protein ACXVQS_05855 [Actinomycetota bacterium]
MKRHPIDPFSLVFGATFTALGLTFLLTRADITSLHLQWVWPIPIVVLGIVIIALAARGPRGEPASDESEDPRRRG